MDKIRFGRDNDSAVDQETRCLHDEDYGKKICIYFLEFFFFRNRLFSPRSLNNDESPVDNAFANYSGK